MSVNLHLLPVPTDEQLQPFKQPELGVIENAEAALVAAKLAVTENREKLNQFLFDYWSQQGLAICMSCFQLGPIDTFGYVLRITPWFRDRASDRDPVIKVYDKYALYHNCSTCLEKARKLQGKTLNIRTQTFLDTHASSQYVSVVEVSTATGRPLYTLRGAFGKNDQFIGLISDDERISHASRILERMQQ